MFIMYNIIQRVFFGLHVHCVTWLQYFYILFFQIFCFCHLFCDFLGASIQGAKHSFLLHFPLKYYFCLTQQCRTRVVKHFYISSATKLIRAALANFELLMISIRRTREKKKLRKHSSLDIR